MNSFKNSNQGRRMREWKGTNMAGYEPWNIDYSDPRQFQKMIDKRERDKKFQDAIDNENLSRQYDWVNSPAYQAARHKAIKDKFHAYIIVSCAILVIAILMFWP